MQRIKPKENQIITNNLKQQTSYIFKNNIPNGNVNKNIEQNIFINNDIISKSFINSRKTKNNLRNKWIKKTT